MQEKENPNDDKYWYGFAGWRQTRRLVLAAGRREAPQLLDDLEQSDRNIKRDVTRYIERVARSILSRNVGSASTKAQYAVSLIADTSMLVTLIEADGVFAGVPERAGINRAAAFWQIYKTFVNRSRLKLGGTTQNRLTVWEAIDRVSRQIVAEAGFAGDSIDRLSTDHINAVHKRLATERAGNRNLTVNIPALRGYFQEFYEGANEQFNEDEPSASLQQYMMLTTDTEMTIAVGQCLNRLVQQNGQDDLDAVLVKYGHHPNVTAPFSKYHKQIDITAYELQKRFDRGFLFLWKCFQLSLDFALRR